MCGIAGYLNFQDRPASTNVLKAMTDIIRHRGPDGEGAWVEGPAAIGHRRLAIIDLSPSAAQPMRTDDGRFVLTYNGEIYNFRELRDELETYGHTFKSTGDTEVVLNALAQWGTVAIKRFNGMFALALWDRQTKQLLLARDRFGIKPLYFAKTSNAFLFGSEIKAIASHPDVQLKINRSALLEYLTFQNFFTTSTIFEGVNLLPPGTILTVRQDGQIDERRYWDYSFREPGLKRSEDDLVAELDHLFRRAVSRQLVSDVELGCYLSGGMDSGSITAVAAKRLPYVKSFTCGFDLSSASGMELSFDERAAAERMSYAFKTEHYEMVLKAGDMERSMRQLVWHLEEPRVGQSYPIFYAAKMASKFVKVVMSGTGGDELFGGYPWRYYRAVVNDDFEHYIDQYYEFWQRLIPDDLKSAVFTPIWDDVRNISTRDIFRDVLAQSDRRLALPEDYVNHSLYLEAKTFLHGLLVVEDKLSMAHSLETRVPFLDNDLVDFAMSLPVTQKLGNLDKVVRLKEDDIQSKRDQYFHRFRDGKLLLRRMMESYVPEDIANGEKQGFSGPDGSWFKGESIDYVRDKLFGRHVRIYDFLDRGEVQRLVRRHLDGQENRRLLIWSLIYLENLLDVFQVQTSSIKADLVAAEEPIGVVAAGARAS